MKSKNFTGPLYLHSIKQLQRTTQIFLGQHRLTIEELWAAYYSPNMSATDAATLQLAIWDVVGGSTFTTTSTLNIAAENWINTVNAANGPAANLVGLTGSGQDYVVQSTPEPSSIALLGVGLLGLLVAMRKRIPLCQSQAN